MTELLNRIDTITTGKVDSNPKKINRVGGDLTFFDVFKARLEKDSGITFSAHAAERLRQRNVTIGGDELERLNDAVNRADEKGSSDSLVILDNTAFIVSVKNRTVVTVIADENMKNNVFTNIDSTVIA